MNFKKIIPLSFAALSVAGALSACSDSAVVGADVQDNSMAQNSSSSVTPGSSESLDLSGLQLLPIETVAAFRSARRGTAVTYSHIAGEPDYQTDSVTAHESYERAVQSIIDADFSVRNTDEIRDFDTTAFEESYKRYKMDYTTEVSMKDENGLVYGDIYFYREDDYNLDRHAHVSCGISYTWGDDGSFVQVLGYGDYLKNYVGRDGGYGFFGTMYEIYFQSKKSPVYKDSIVTKYFVSIDSAVREEFRKDCLLENGEVHNGVGDDPQIVCLVKVDEVNGIQTYKDPNWKKYAKHIAESCVSNRDFDELYKPDEYLERVLREYYGDEEYEKYWKNE